MNAKKTALIFVQSTGAEFKETMDILARQLQSRGLNGLCVITAEDYGVKKTPQEQADAIIKMLEQKDCIPATQKEEEVYSKEDEEKIKKRLEDLGYL